MKKNTPHLDLTQSDASVGVLVQHPQYQPLQVGRYTRAEKQATYSYIPIHCNHYFHIQRSLTMYSAELDQGLQLQSIHVITQMLHMYFKYCVSITKALSSIYMCFLCFHS